MCFVICRIHLGLLRAVPSRQVASILNFGGGSTDECNVANDIHAISNCGVTRWSMFMDSNFFREAEMIFSFGSFGGEGLYSLFFFFNI